MYKQIIIARKDLGMSAGKLAAQVSHASMAFLTCMIKSNSQLYDVYDNPENEKYLGEKYRSEFWIEKDLYEQWINGEFAKIVLQAKNKNSLLKAKEIAEAFGMVEGIDFFLIKDNCHTELKPEEDGSTLTCIGFKPMDSGVIDQISKKYHLYIGD